MVEETEATPKHKQKYLGAKSNQFVRDLPPGEWKVNVEGTEPIDFLMHLFPKELMHSKMEMKTFLGINLVMSYIRSRIYWSSEEGLGLDLIAGATPLVDCSRF